MKVPAKQQFRESWITLGQKDTVLGVLVAAVPVLSLLVPSICQLGATREGKFISRWMNSGRAL